jgi:phosphate transport system substrate-binding protein
MPSDFRVSLVNSPNPDAYPVAGFTWLLIYKNQEDAFKGRALVDFIHWAIHEGQAYTKDLIYAPLPNDVVAMIEKKMSEVKVAA